MKYRICLLSCTLTISLVCFSGAKRDTTGDLPLLGSADFEEGKADGWQPNHPGNWRVIEHEGSLVYELITPGEHGKVRAPTSWSLLAGYDVTSFEFTGRLKSNADTANPHRDLCIFFCFQDSMHFYYVHFSASSDDAHNIIGFVNGSDRIKINIEPPGKAVVRLTDLAWHDFKVTHDAASGRTEAFLDDMPTPILTAVDRTLGHGLVGVGSFDDAGFFDDLKLRGIEKKTVL